MNLLQTILILAAAFLAVFGEATFPVVRHWLGAQVDLLPVLMVYAALNADLATVSLLAVLGGLWLTPCPPIHSVSASCRFMPSDFSFPSGAT